MTITDTWNPEQYAKFQREREQPFIDLLEMVRPMANMRVVDLGCGAGRLTRLLHAHLHARETIGIDQSPRMIQAALQEPPPAGLRFQIGDIATFKAEAEYDLLISSSALQWVEGHDELIGRFSRALRPGGQLVFQVPAMDDHPSHTIAAALAQSEAFRGAFGGWQLPTPVAAPDEYARLLDKHGFTHPHVRLVVYSHQLAGPEDVVEWMKGTLLTGYERRVTPEVFGRFLREYQARLLAELEPSRPFFFPYKRILVWGRSAF
jgi:trans-aconitate 2-methyltransferase